MEQEKSKAGTIFLAIIIIAVIVGVGIYIWQKNQVSQPTELGDVIITLERTACFGTCPIYKLTISGDGKVVYEGEKFVNVLGTQTDEISQEKVKELVDEFDKIGYFSL